MCVPCFMAAIVVVHSIQHKHHPLACSNTNTIHWPAPINQSINLGSLQASKQASHSDKAEQGRQISFWLGAVDQVQAALRRNGTRFHIWATREVPIGDQHNKPLYSNIFSDFVGTRLDMIQILPRETFRQNLLKTTMAPTTTTTTTTYNMPSFVPRLSEPSMKALFCLRNHRMIA